jgi:osmoprotectant transport system ATP-binding protein
MNKPQSDNKESKIQILKSKIDDPVIQFRGVSLSVSGGKKLVADLNFDVVRGETLVLVGRSGSGKTTTLKLINRLLEPTEGEVRVEGKPTLEWDAIRLRRRIGYVIQETGLFPHFTVERNVALVPRLEGWPEDRRRERVRELLELVGLAPDAFANRFPQELSGGQRQRVGVARALAADPPVILMDEPFGALDPLTRVQLQREFAALASRLKKTIVFVTHDIREAFTLASRIGLFKDGRLVVLAAPSEFIASDDPEAIAFLETLRISDFELQIEREAENIRSPRPAGGFPEIRNPQSS